MKTNPPQANKRPWVKICGLTDPDTAAACAAAGADAIGLVFFDKSPRYVTTDQAAAISRCLPGPTIPIGVFVDQSFDAIMDTVRHCRLKGVQLHGEESVDLVKQLAAEQLVVIKALFAGKSPGLDRYQSYRHSSFLLVEYGKGRLPGGNAEAWDYRLCRTLSMKTDLILAGGLDPDNVYEAVQSIGPAGVDVSSGVELSPGIKDIKKVARFINNLKN